jgi:aerobic-type carbon monoxide dehydrogenase small subunit (CoxS/CutS family)
VSRDPYAPPEPLQVTVTVNDADRTVEVEPRTTLAELLRDGLGMTGTKVACELQVCGACTVLLDGQPVSACTTLAAEAVGRSVTTIEGLASGGALHPVQSAFADAGGFQCGYCTPGMILTVLALLRDNPDPSAEEVKDYLAGNLCRCTGYHSIISAALDAAARCRRSGTL